MLETSFDILHVLKKKNVLLNKPSWWWQGALSFEVILGSILVQNTQWKHVEKSLDSMRKAQIICDNDEEDLAHIAKLEAHILHPHIIGLHNQKSLYLINLARHIIADFGSFEVFKHEVDCEWLLAQKGIGRESAYAILNYACGREVMVVDRYTYKLLKALGREIEDYEELRSFCESGVRENFKRAQELYINQFDEISLAQIFARFHGKIVEFAKMKGDVALLLKEIECL